MTTKTPEELMDEAARIFADDPERACDLRRQVTNTPVSHIWSNAHMDLAWHEFGMGNFERASEHTEAVLNADPQLVDPKALAVAGVLANNFRDFLQQPIDEQLLQRSIKSCLDQGQIFYAAFGLGDLAHFRNLAGDRAAAKTALESSVALYDHIGSEGRGPSALFRLANMALEDNDHQAAVAYIDRALAHLERFPYRGRSTRMLEDKLRKLRSKILE